MNQTILRPGTDRCIDVLGLPQPCHQIAKKLLSAVPVQFDFHKKPKALERVTTDYHQQEKYHQIPFTPILGSCC